MQLPTQSEQACVSVRRQQGWGLLPPMRGTESKKSCSFTPRGAVHTRIQSTPPSKLQKQVSVPRCEKMIL